MKNKNNKPEMKEALNYVIQSQNADYQAHHGGQIPTSLQPLVTAKLNKPSRTINRWLKCWKTSLGFVLLGVENTSNLMSRLGDRWYIQSHTKRLDLYCEVYGLSYDDYEESMDRWPLRNVEMDGK